MKKLLFALSLCTLLISCGNKALKDNCGCFADYDEALASAGKNTQPLLIVFTQDGEEIKVPSKYAVFHADFSQKAYQKMSAPDDATTEQQQLANTYTTIMQKNYQLAILLGVSQMPAAFLCTKEGYVVAEIECDDFSDKALLENKLNSYAAELDRFNKLVAQTKKGSATEKVEAIDGIFIATNQTYRTFLLPLVQTAIDLDKTNETGLVGKFILAQAQAQSMFAYSQGDVEEAVKQYLNAANNEFLKDEEKQECFYTAAYLVTASGSTDYEGIIEYMQTAYDLAPNSAKAPAIKDAIAYFETVAEKSSEYDESQE